MAFAKGFSQLDQGASSSSIPPPSSTSSTSSFTSFFSTPAQTTPPPPQPPIVAAPTSSSSSSFGGFFGGSSSQSQTAASSASTTGSAKAPTLSSLTAAVTGQSPEQAAWEAQCSLTRTQRMYGFGICFTIGCLISLGSTLRLLIPTDFALWYSLGNLVSFAATGFLVGPVAQCKMACDKSRALATTIFLTSMIATLLTALLYKGGGLAALCIILIIIQFSALVWYTASYIPMGQAMICSCVKGVMGKAVGAASG